MRWDLKTSIGGGDVEGREAVIEGGLVEHGGLGVEGGGDDLGVARLLGGE